MDYIVFIVVNMYLQNLVKIVTLLSLLIQVSTQPQTQDRETRFVCHLNSYLQRERERDRERQRERETERDRERDRESTCLHPTLFILPQ